MKHKPLKWQPFHLKCLGVFPLWFSSEWQAQSESNMTLSSSIGCKFAHLHGFPEACCKTRGVRLIPFTVRNYGRSKTRRLAIVFQPGAPTATPRESFRLELK